MQSRCSTRTHMFEPGQPVILFSQEKKQNIHITYSLSANRTNDILDSIHYISTQNTYLFDIVVWNLIKLLTYEIMCATSGAGTVYHSGAHEYSPFLLASYCTIFSFLRKSLFVILSFYHCIVCHSSNYSYLIQVYTSYCIIS